MHTSPTRHESTTARSTTAHRLKLALVGGVGCLTFVGTRVAVASTLDVEEAVLAYDAAPVAPAAAARRVIAQSTSAPSEESMPSSSIAASSSAPSRREAPAVAVERGVVTAPEPSRVETTERTVSSARVVFAPNAPRSLDADRRLRAMSSAPTVAPVTDREPVEPTEAAAATNVSAGTAAAPVVRASTAPRSLDADRRMRAMASEPASAPATAAPAAAPPAVPAPEEAAPPLASGMSDWRALIAHPGVSLSFAEITDASSAAGALSAAHGLRTHSSVILALDMDSIAGWRGLSVFAQYKQKTGRNASGEAAFMQNFSNIDADDFRAFGEVWLEQRLFSERVRVKGGRIDFNTEFAGTNNGANFLNASMGFSPSIAAAPTFPLPSLGANVIIAPSATTSFSVGVLDGLDGAPAATGRRSLFQIAQFRQSWTMGSSQLPGTLGVGGWRHTGLFAAVDARVDSAPSVIGTQGWYATLDQELWQGAAHAAPDDPRASVAAFAQIGRSSPLVQTVTRHEGGGLTFTGFVPRRLSDQLGVGVTRASWRSGHESIGEAFYQLPITSYLAFVADIQRVFQRDVSFDRRNGTVTTLRTIVSF